jgi:hypothetical protein|tara:strand:+ start:777 stop:962 length:186 start_codon:yes stop_codon:yes gene_type:complete
MADQYTVEFRAPALPYPPTEYSAAEFEQFNKILRLYFNQLDSVLRDTSLADKSDAVGWFVS